MNQLQASDGNCWRKIHASRSGSARIIMLSLACFLAGAALCAFWLLRTTPRAPVPMAGAPSLSDATKAVLHRLESPVEIRFYSLLDPHGSDGAAKAFSARVDRLIELYQQEGGGKIQFTKADSISYANSAVADGITPFNLDKGNGCFLGIAILAKGQRESLPRLASEWESALESDLTRGIVRVASAAPSTPQNVKVDTASLDAVRHSLPNLGSISVEQGTQDLRAAALAEFQKTALAMQAEINKAQQEFLQAQNGQSRAQQENALKRLRQIEADQTDKLKQIAINTRAQISALQQIKKEAQ